MPLLSKKGRELPFQVLGLKELLLLLIECLGKLDIRVLNLKIGGLSFTTNNNNLTLRLVVRTSRLLAVLGRSFSLTLRVRPLMSTVTIVAQEEHLAKTEAITDT